MFGKFYKFGFSKLKEVLRISKIENENSTHNPQQGKDNYNV